LLHHSRATPPAAFGRQGLELEKTPDHHDQKNDANHTPNQTVKFNQSFNYGVIAT